MKKNVGLTLGIVCMAMALNAQASTSAQLAVRGTIVPAACNLSLAGSGTIDYGTILSSELSQTEFNTRDERTTPVTVNCGSTPARFGLTFTDLQTGSRVPGILGTGFTEAQNYGLGMVGTRRTGGFSITLKNLQSSIGVLNPIVRSGAGAWASSDGKVAQAPSQYSWRSGATVTPAAINQLTGTLAVKAVLNKGQDLDLSRDVVLDGRVTLILSYI